VLHDIKRLNNPNTSLALTHQLRSMLGGRQFSTGPIYIIHFFYRRRCQKLNEPWLIKPPNKI